MEHATPLLLTKILATVGPATRDVGVLVKLIEAGARCFRVNFSHGTFDEFDQTVKVIRKAAAETGRSIGILGDLSGPKIRVTTVPGDGIELAVGDHVELTARDVEASRDGATGVVTLGTTYPKMVEEVEPGDRLLINDGAIRMLVTDRVGLGDADENGRNPGDPRLICSVLVGGLVTSKKGINLPDSEISAPALTEWDEECAAWAVANEVDYLALSFVRKAEDVTRLKAMLRELGRDHRGLRSHTRLPLVAKIEKPQAIRELDSIIDEVDAVMVARGDLGVEMDLSEVPVLQKRIIGACHERGKAVIVATQMLESMIESATPTRAEVSDVANAILDGADAVMLSGETAVGAWPERAVTVMARTAEKAERYGVELGLRVALPTKGEQSKYRPIGVARGVEALCRDLHPRYVVTWSELGGGARYLAQRRLPMPVIAVSSNPEALRQMSLYFGIVPVYMPRPTPPDANASFIEAIDRLVLGNKWADPGDAVVIVQGEPLGTPGVTNKIRVHYVGDVCRLTWHAK
ncbi:MAG: pyruvate kinase [Planctomycetota bacterium]